MSAPVLAMPDEESRFLLDVGAVQTSIGAVLYDRQQGVEKSRGLRKPEVVEMRQKLLRDAEGAFGEGLLREVLQTLPAK